jgi:hypothetical protein
LGPCGRAGLARGGEIAQPSDAVERHLVRVRVRVGVRVRARVRARVGVRVRARAQPWGSSTCSCVLSGTAKVQSCEAWLRSKRTTYLVIGL